MAFALLVAATVVSGLLAGMNVDRAVVAMPAWRRVGPVAWAEFSRRADLGNGKVVYPAEAVGGFLLILAALTTALVEGRALGAAVLPLAVAAIFAAAGLVFTVKAAPFMLGIHSEADPARLARAFAGFLFWGNLRGVCQVMAFLACVWALAA
jgi:hypothetical protein